MWNDRAVEIWGMNYPGFGGSTGPARLSQIGPAALAAFDELKRQAGGRPIVLFGASIGATAALHVAAQRPETRLILHNPPPLRQMILRQFGWWNLWLLAGPVALQIPRDLDSLSNAKAIHAPAIFLLAEKDEVVAPRFHRLVVDGLCRRKARDHAATALITTTQSKVPGWQTSITRSTGCCRRRIHLTRYSDCLGVAHASRVLASASSRSRTFPNTSPDSVIQGPEKIVAARRVRYPSITRVGRTTSARSVFVPRPGTPTPATACRVLRSLSPSR